MDRAQKLMFQGDSTVDSTASCLGMEARSIVKSIQTEHSKLLQTGQWARSDLHYFRARFQYYRLSLMRLEAAERKFIEPILNQFREQIVALERQGSDMLEAPPTPFLAPVEAKLDPVRPEAEKLDFNPSLNSNVNSNLQWKQRVIGELELIQVALSAEASNDRNRVIAGAVERAIKAIKE